MPTRQRTPVPALRRLGPTTAMLAGLLASGCAHHAITGSVVDRNGEPVDRVVVSLDPGGVQRVTDSSGAFMVDYLRDEAGERIKLAKRTDYSVEAFKPGYHIATTSFHYKKGELIVEPITLLEDTIRVESSQDNIDPEQFPDRTHSAGSNYEGE